MTFGKDCDEATSGELFHTCRDAGINMFDTANIYGGNRDGRGEEILAEVEKSLRRLHTDRIDIYYVHKLDPTTPMEETLRALDDLQRQGKIVHAGISNSAAWRIAQALENQLGVATYSPLAAGLLTGKYFAKDPSPGRLVSSERYRVRYQNPRYHDAAAAFAEHARQRGIKPATLAIAWAMSHPAVASSLIGARSLDQLHDSLAAVDLGFSHEWRDEITAFSVPPAHPTDRDEEWSNWSVEKPHGS